MSAHLESTIRLQSEFRAQDLPQICQRACFWLPFGSFRVIFSHVLTHLQSTPKPCLSGFSVVRSEVVRVPLADSQNSLVGLPAHNVDLNGFPAFPVEGSERGKANWAPPLA